MNPLDSIVSWLSPRAGAERLFQRYRMEIIRGQLEDRKGRLRRYDAASRGRRNAGWVAGGGSANAEVQNGLSLLRNRSRELVRNNSWAAKAVQVLTSNVVGAGIMAKPDTDDEVLAQRISELWKAWALTTECDPGRKMTFHGMQSLGFRSTVEGGEHLIRRRRRRVADRLAVPLQLQLLEGDHIDTDRTEQMTNGDRLIQGVQFDPLGRPRAYWLYPDHPGELGHFQLSGGSFRSDRITASSVIHPFNVQRIGQVRGVPWGASCLIRLRDFDDYTDAQLVRQKLAACYVAFVHDPVGKGTNTLGTTQPSEIPDEFTPGMVEELPPGKQIEFSSPPVVEGFKDYADVTLHEVAAGYGVTYESLTGDLAGVSFSAGRMGWLEFFRSIVQWRSFVMIPQVCDPVWRWFMDAAIAAGEIERFIPATWTPPRRDMIDPAKEVKALTDMVKSGFISLSEGIRGLGYDPRAVLEELAKDRELALELGLTLDSIASAAGGSLPPSNAEDRAAIDEDAEDDEATREGAA